MERKLPADFAIDALVAEVERRKNEPHRNSFSYGKLIAETTYPEREKIVEDYRRGVSRKDRGGTRSVFLDRENNAVAGFADRREHSDD